MLLTRIAPTLALLLSGLTAASSVQQDLHQKPLSTLNQDGSDSDHPEQPLDFQRVVLQAWPILPAGSTPPSPVPFAIVEYAKPAKPQTNKGRICRLGDQDEALTDPLSESKAIKTVIIEYTRPTKLIDESSHDYVRIGLNLPDGVESGTSIASAKLFSPDVNIRIVLTLDYNGDAWRAEIHPSSVLTFSNQLSDNSVQDSTVGLTEKQLLRLEIRKKKQADRKAFRERKLEERKQKLLAARKAAGVDLDEAAKKDAERAKKAAEKKKKAAKKDPYEDEQTEPVVMEVKLMQCGAQAVLSPRVVVNPDGKVEGGDAPEEEKSLFQRYWWVLAMFLAMQVIGPLIREGQKEE